MKNWGPFSAPRKNTVAACIPLSGGFWQCPTRCGEKSQWQCNRRSCIRKTGVPRIFERSNKLDRDTRFRPNLAKVAAKVIDGEAILINLDTGAYYSMEGVGGAIWHLVENQLTVSDMVETITTAYKAPAEKVEPDVHRTLEELLKEDLVVAADEATVRQGEEPNADLANGQAYEAPVLNAYHDMSALLALDPPPPLLEDLPKTSRDR